MDLERHCLTYHSDETPIAYLATDRTAEEVIQIYKYFLFLSGLFHRSSLHQIMCHEMMGYIQQGQTLQEATENAVNDWKHEIGEIYMHCKGD